MSTRSAVGCWTAVALAVLAAGCGTNDLAPPPRDESDLFWSLELDHHAVTLSMTDPSDTLTVTAVPRNVDGGALSGLGTPRYASSDNERVRVTPEGLLLAVAPSTDDVVITATLTAGNLKHTDSVLVKVMAVDPPPVLADLSINVVPPDSAKVGASATANFRSCALIPLALTDTAGASLLDAGIPVAFHTDTTKANVAGDASTGYCVAGKRMGVVRIGASATVFGVTKADTVEYQVGWPVIGAFHLVPAPNGAPGNVFIEREMRLGVGAVVFWDTQALDTTAQVVVEDSVNVLSPYDRPNVLDAPSLPPQYILLLCQYLGSDCGSEGTMTLPSVKFLGVAAIRIFPIPGTYRVRDPVSGDRVRVVIIDES